MSVGDKLLAELILFVLYAEIHYKFTGIYSRLFKTEPEIIADAPHRINPGELLPVFIIVKDANRYPVFIDSVRMTIMKEEKSWQTVVPIRENITAPFWSKTCMIKPFEDQTGNIQVDVEINGLDHKGRLAYRNDNYRGTSHAPLRVCLARERLPAAPDWYFGDLHVHSNFTSDQVEFGASLTDTRTAARALGLTFLAITDHSYDLDDHFDNYLKNHPDLPKWKALQEQIALLNAEDRHFVLIPGEEVSCGNSHDRNVHFLVFNSPDFYQGHGDSAERWFHTRPQLSAIDILERLPPQALAFAAHPEVKPPFLQRILIHRGRWLDNDYRHPRLNGMQILNGMKDAWLEKGIRKWVERLLSGQQLFIVAGNDAHGNFNRFRQIRLPFFRMEEHDQQILGRCRTGLYVPGAFSQSAVLAALRQGQALITDGPFANMLAVSDDQQVMIGGKINRALQQLEITARSSAEFGFLNEIKLFCGDIKNRQEFICFHVNLAASRYEFQAIVTDIPQVAAGYIRLEVTSKKAEIVYRCLTNPIWYQTEKEITGFCDDPTKKF